jgi:hypothetical protein
VNSECFFYIFSVVIENLCFRNSDENICGTYWFCLKKVLISVWLSGFLVVIFTAYQDSKHYKSYDYIKWSVKILSLHWVSGAVLREGLDVPCWSVSLSLSFPFFWMVLGFEYRVLHLLGKCSTLKPVFALVIFKRVLLLWPSQPGLQASCFGFLYSWDNMCMTLYPPFFGWDGVSQTLPELALNCSPPALHLPSS